MGRLDNKVAIVTGGSLGIGEAICRLFAKEGAKVAILSRGETAGKALEKSIRDEGYEATWYQCSVSDEDRVKTVFDEVVKQYGQIDVLVNNAGMVGTPNTTHNISLEEFMDVLNVDVVGTFLCSKHAITDMLKHGGGSIINIGSIYKECGSDDLGAYHVAKGAVAAETKADAIAYAKDNIRVNIIHPGTIMTPLLEKDAARTPMGRDGYLKLLCERHPVGWLGEGDDVAYAALYFASDESRFTTGAELAVDGGYTAI